MLISASRRTDIPAFHADWLVARLHAGWVDVANPFNPRQVRRISLKPADVDAIVFWTKNATPLLPHLGELDRIGYRYGFLHTVNPYGSAWEPQVPCWEDRIASFRRAADHVGPGRMAWRYDPIILSDQMPAAYHLEAFERTARALAGATSRVIVSLLDGYPKLRRRLAAAASATRDRLTENSLTDPGLPELARGLLTLARQHGLRLQTCAEPPSLAGLGLMPGACLDAGWLRESWGLDLSPAKDRGQREHCLCVTARDIGTCRTCGHGCAYCYAS
jgi:DNA repair photolyase